MAKNKVPVKASENKPAPKRKQGSWLAPNLPLSETPGETSKMIRLNLELAQIQAPDLNDPEQVLNNIQRYFEIYADYDMKPTVVGLGLALGLDRRRVWEVVHGDFSKLRGYHNHLNDSSVDLIKKTYDILENLWENSFNSGKINPVAGIFLAKNHFGYKDQTDYVVSPGGNSGSDFTRDQIAERYASDYDSDSVIDSDDSTSDS